MKAITLTQPWATLVAIGAKCIETRSWSTPYRGPLAIHAAAGLGPVGGLRGLQRLCDRVEFANALWAGGIRKGPPPDDAWADRLPFGAIIAVCDLVDCVAIVHRWQEQLIQQRDNRWFVSPPITSPEYAFGDYTPGRYAWLLDTVQPLPEPIPAKGQLGLWEWTES